MHQVRKENDMNKSETIDIERILVPTDFSEAGKWAIKYAIAIADQFGASVDLLHVIEMPPLTSFKTDKQKEELRDNMHTHAEEQMDLLQNECDGFSFPVDKYLVEGFPFVEIIRHAKEKNSDMIIMGTHGQSALSQMLMGSVAEKTVRKAPCPVLTVRHPEHKFVFP